MPATPSEITFKESDFKERLSYDELEPGDYEGTLTDVKDAEAKTGNVGWRFIFDVQGLPVSSTVWLKGGGVWKVREVFNALGMPIEPGTEVTTLDPNILIGRMCVVTIVKEASKTATNDDGTPRIYTNVSRHTPFVAEPVMDLST